MATGVGNGPDNWQTFFEVLEGALSLAEGAFGMLAEAEPEQAGYYEAACLPIAGVRVEMAALQDAAGANEEVALNLDRVLTETGASRLLATTVATGAGTAGPGREQLAAAQTGLDIGKDILTKASKWLPPPWNNVAGNIADVVGIVSKLAGDKTAMAKLAAAVADVQAELDKVESKSERLGELAGHPVVTTDAGSTTVVGPPPTAGFGPSTIPGSLLWMTWQNQFKLEHLWRKTYGTDFAADQQGWLQAPPELSTVTGIYATWMRENGGELGRLAYKIDKLADLLGRAIVDAKAVWNPEPPIHGRTVERPHHNQLPEKSVKEELHDLEDLLDGLRQVIILWFDIDITDIDVDIDIVNVVNKYSTKLLASQPLKRIYVYDEGVFAAADDKDMHRIRVNTPAFDLAGWIDLDELRVGDEVRVDVYVHLPSPSPGRRRRRLYRRAVFSGIGRTVGHRARRSADGRGLKSLQDICGPTQLVGGTIDIEIRQVASARGYSPPLDIAYQFVVESSDSPAAPITV